MFLTIYGVEKSQCDRSICQEQWRGGSEAAGEAA